MQESNAAIMPHNANETLTLDVPVREFTRNILLRSEGESLSTGVIKLTESDLAGKALICYQAEIGFDMQLPQLPGATIRLQLSHRLYHQFYKWNKADGLLVLGSFYEKVAMRTLHSWLDCAVALSMPKQRALDAAYEHFEIDEWMLPQENVLQLYKYHRKQNSK
jgi:hypothetical protein